MTHSLTLKDCPANMRPHVEQVFAGEYDIATWRSPRLIIDIGANIGAFSVWASQRWPEAEIHAYEPYGPNYRRLLKNLADNPAVTAYRKAVAAQSGSRQLFIGRNNDGECSFFAGDEQQEISEAVEAISAAELPNLTGAFLKIDTEGCELEILLTLFGKENFPLYIALEYHSETDRRQIDTLLKDYVLVGSWSGRKERGTVRYERKF